MSAVNTTKLLYLNPITSPTIRCQLCGEAMYVLTKHHLREAHGITKEEYIRRFPRYADLAYWGTAPSYGPAKDKHNAVVRKAVKH